MQRLESCYESYIWLNEGGKITCTLLCSVRTDGEHRKGRPKCDVLTFNISSEQWQTPRCHSTCQSNFRKRSIEKSEAREHCNSEFKMNKKKRKKKKERKYSIWNYLAMCRIWFQVNFRAQINRKALCRIHRGRQVNSQVTQWPLSCSFSMACSFRDAQRSGLFSTHFWHNLKRLWSRRVKNAKKKTAAKSGLLLNARTNRRQAMSNELTQYCTAY